MMVSLRPEGCSRQMLPKFIKIYAYQLAAQHVGRICLRTLILR